MRYVGAALAFGVTFLVGVNVGALIRSPDAAALRWCGGALCGAALVVGWRFIMAERRKSN